MKVNEYLGAGSNSLRRLKMIKILKRALSALHPKKNYLLEKPVVDVSDKWLGSDYGGFFVATELLDYKKNREIIVYSAGVGTDISFDLALIRNYKSIKIYAFDPTPRSIEWIGRKKIPPNFIFAPVGIGSENKKETMFLPKSHRVSFTVHSFEDENKDEIEVEMKSIATIAQENRHTFIDILKLDIEGSEFSVLEALDFNTLKFGQILVEFHERFLPNGLELKNRIIQRLDEAGYVCFAISSDFEYSFVNKKVWQRVF